MSESRTWQVGDRLEMRGGASRIWFPAEVRAVSDGCVTVHSDGWNEDILSEITEPERLRPLTEDDTVTIRKSGSVFATVDGDGTIRVGGSIVGSLAPAAEYGLVRKGGSLVSQVNLGGLIYKNGSEVGVHEPLGDLRRNGSVVGSIDPLDGTIRRGGAIWGGIDDYTQRWRDLRATVAVLVFFSGDFGY